MNEFSERYKSLSNSDLLKIINKSSDYQFLAIQAVKGELENRNLSKEDIDSINNQIREEQEKEEIKIKERQKQVSLVEQKIKFFIEMLNPIQKQLPTPEKIIRIVTIAYAGLFLIKFVKEFRFLIWMFADSEAGWDLSMFFYFFPIIILPFAIILFWRRKQIGWILLSIYLSYTIFGALYMFISDLVLKFKLENEIIYNLFPKTPPIYYLVGSVVLAVTLWTISKKDLREIYKIENKKILISIGAGGLLTYISMAII